MNYKSLLLCFCFWTGIIVSAQNKSWFLGAAFSPHVCYRSVSVEGEFNNALKEQRNGDETIRLGFTSGLMLRRNLDALGFMETGLLYSSKGYAIYADAVFGDQINPTQGITGTSTYTSQRQFNFIDIPFKMNYVFHRRERSDIFMVTGFNLNYLLEQKNVVYIYRDPQEDESYTSYTNVNDLNRINVSPVLGAGIDKKIGNRVHLQVETLMTYGILPVNQENAFATTDTRLWTLGLNAILYYRL